MLSRSNLRNALLAGVAVAAVISTAAQAQTGPVNFDIASGDLNTALASYAKQSGVELFYQSRIVEGRSTQGLHGSFAPREALDQLLKGTGLVLAMDQSGALVVKEASAPQSGSAAGDGADSGTVQALVVTAQKREEDIQDVPIAISAFTQEDLTRSQVAGGPDLMTQVPNMTFTKTNFSSYSIQLRGIGTQAISATTDPAVAVAFNNTPFIRNRFFEQEFYDLQRVEVLRGPQGTLYGRNATAGVVNIISAKPNLSRFEAKASADMANYNSTRLEAMVNLPLADDRVALRLAGAWTKREGFVTNEITGNPIDGRDLWSTRVSLRVAPADGIEANLIWEHFEENDDRLRSGKQLCHQDDRTEFAGYNIGAITGYSNPFSQGCLPASLYSPDSFEAPNGYSLPYYLPLIALGFPAEPGFNPYASLVQSSDLRVIESTVDPEYTAKSDLVELQASVDLGAGLTLTSESAYNYDNIFSSEDYNRFNTASGAFHIYPNDTLNRPILTEGEHGPVFCDPQVGCADRVVAVDVSRARSRQFSQEFRLSSEYNGPFNFSLGANFLRYDTEDKYYVFINTLTMFAALGGYAVGGSGLQPWVPGVTDNHECLPQGGVEADPRQPQLLSGCIYIDPNPIHSVDDLGHHYFLSRNPYKLISYAAFGEAYYNLLDNLKVTAGLRFTVDKKEAPRIPSWVLGSNTIGYPVLAVEEQEWREPTGRLTVDWKPELGFTDETLLYASFSHGYKAGGSNPPPSGIVGWGLPGLDVGPIINGMVDQSAVKPKTFDPEFVNAYELGAKNTLLDGRATLNGNVFFYDYKDYQVSQIIDRSAVNYNFDAKIWGVELEATWLPFENLRLGFKGGYENTRVADGERAIDIMERNAGHGPDSNDPWVVVRPFPSFPSNCVLPLYTLVRGDALGFPYPTFSSGHEGPCERAYVLDQDPVTALPYVPNPTVSSLIDQPPAGYIGYNPSLDVGQNHGEGFFKELGGNALPNAPHFTATITADYTLPLPSDWFMTLHTDLYYQSEAWTRIFNMPGYDKLKAYTNVNLAAIFQNDDAGWKVMAYVKNVMDRDSITGSFLNSDDTGLTTNVFLTEPRLYGLRVTKEWNGAPWWPQSSGHSANESYPWTLQLGGSLSRMDAAYSPVRSAGDFQSALDPARYQNGDLSLAQGGETKLTYTPTGSLWRVSTGIRYGKTKGLEKIQANEATEYVCGVTPPYDVDLYCGEGSFLRDLAYRNIHNWLRGEVTHYESHFIADFEVGRDIGLGAEFESAVTAGLRYLDLEASTHLDSSGVPDGYLPEGWLFGSIGYHYYDTDVVNANRFEGFGPTLRWDIAKRLVGDDEGHLDVDMAVTGGVLFGRQKTTTSGEETVAYYSGNFLFGFPFLKPVGPAVITPVSQTRSSSATVPLAGAELGLSYQVSRVKIDAGYRWERYFNVLDAGYAERKSYDRTIDGPYFKIAVGFGG
jgi:outer membrane receptor protein involved in Fe transport